MKKIRLTQDKFALVDDELFDELNKHRWCAHRHRKTWYAVRSIRLPDGRWTLCRMHRYIFELLGASVPKSVDHRDRNGLNNRRSNLRAATASQQTRNQGKRIDNTSGYIGVHWNQQRLNWRAQVLVNGKVNHLGSFTDPFSAAWIRDAFVRRLDPNAQLNDLVDRRASRRRQAATKVRRVVSAKRGRP